MTTPARFTYTPSTDEDGDPIEGEFEVYVKGMYLGVVYAVGYSGEWRTGREDYETRRQAALALWRKFEARVDAEAARRDERQFDDVCEAEGLYDEVNNMDPAGIAILNEAISDAVVDMRAALAFDKQEAAPEAEGPLYAVAFFDRLTFALDSLSLLWDRRAVEYADDGGAWLTDSDVLNAAECWTTSSTDIDGCYVEADVHDYEELRDTLFENLESQGS